MPDVVRAIARALSFYALTAVSAAALIAVAWILVEVFPFFFERTKGLWELLFGVDGARTAVVGLAGIVLIACVALATDLLWRYVILGPRLGTGYASNMPTSRIQRLILGITMAAVAALLLFLPGAGGVLATTGSWLPAAGSLGLVPLSVILALVAGTIVYAGDLIDSAWRFHKGLR